MIWDQRNMTLLFGNEDCDIVSGPRNIPSITKYLANKLVKDFFDKQFRVTGLKDKDSDTWVFSELTSSGFDTHRALLIGIVPILKDTPESLLKEIVEVMSRDEISFHEQRDVLERAKKLLGGK